MSSLARSVLSDDMTRSGPEGVVDVLVRRFYTGRYSETSKMFFSQT